MTGDCYRTKTLISDNNIIANKKESLS